MFYIYYLLFTDVYSTKKLIWVFILSFYFKKLTKSDWVRLIYHLSEGLSHFDDDLNNDKNKKISISYSPIP